MHDVTQGIYWDCTQAKSSACQSYTRPASNLVNSTLGTQAEFIIENDTDELSGEGNSHEWPDFSSSPVTMTGTVCVVQGDGIGCCGGGLKCGTVVSTNTDPIVTLQTDNTSSVPPVRGGGHLLITLPTGGVKWADLATNTYFLASTCASGKSRRTENGKSWPTSIIRIVSRPSNITARITRNPEVSRREGCYRASSLGED
jgi:hypothetical protein